jgi:hypothetical protein
VICTLVLIDPHIRAGSSNIFTELSIPRAILNRPFYFELTVVVDTPKSGFAIVLVLVAILLVDQTIPDHFLSKR